MPNPIIEVKGLSKVYRLGEIGMTSLREEIERNVRRWRGKEVGEDKGEFWALNDVSFEVQAGEVLGIIGKNGAGKSTLLKLLSRITEPTHGEIRLRGRVAALLEVGTGFHQELTGRENIYLNGTILGMKKREIDAQLDEIIEFSGVQKHIDTPVKRYSSGMNVRLGFAVAAHLQPEILIVDEVLAVGDADFQKKCIGKMQDVAEHGKTVLFVSHNMTSINSLCDRSLLLDAGSIAKSGTNNEVIDYYLTASNQDISDKWNCNKELLPSQPEFKEIRTSVVKGDKQLDLLVETTIRFPSDWKEKSFVAIDIEDDQGNAVCQALPLHEPFIEPDHTIGLNFSIPLPPLIPGDYFCSFWLGSQFTTTLDSITKATVFQVLESPIQDRIFPHHKNNGSLSLSGKLLSMKSLS